MAGSIVQKLQSMGVGVLAAVITVAAFEHFRERPVSASKQRAELVSRPVGAGTEYRTVIVDGDSSKLSALEDRLQKLEQANRASEAESAPESDTEQTGQQVKDEWASIERTHASDAQDREWAPTAQRHFLEGLTPMSAEFGFKVAEAECKTTTCRATVTFPSYAAARMSGMKLIETLYPGLNCMRRIQLGAPENPDAPYSTRIYLDCADQRAGLADEMAAR